VQSRVVENDKLKVPYLVIGNDLYSVHLAYIENRDPVDFALDTYSMYVGGTVVPKNSALFSGNFLSIPKVRVNTDSYQVQLDYIENNAIFRLLEAPILLANTTDGVLCNYIDRTPNNQDSLSITSTSSWTCLDDSRVLTANGIPDHEVGTFPNPNNPNTISEQSLSGTYTFEPTETNTATTLGGPAGVIGFVLNGVKIDAGTTGTCNDSGDSCNLARGGGNGSIEVPMRLVCCR